MSLSKISSCWSPVRSSLEGVCIAGAGQVWLSLWKETSDFQRKWSFSSECKTESTLIYSWKYLVLAKKNLKLFLFSNPPPPPQFVISQQICLLRQCFPAARGTPWKERPCFLPYGIDLWIPVYLGLTVSACSFPLFYGRAVSCMAGASWTRRLGCLVPCQVSWQEAAHHSFKSSMGFDGRLLLKAFWFCLIVRFWWTAP